MKTAAAVAGGLVLLAALAWLLFTEKPPPPPPEKLELPPANLLTEADLATLGMTPRPAHAKTTPAIEFETHGARFTWRTGFDEQLEIVAVRDRRIHADRSQEEASAARLLKTGKLTAHRIEEGPHGGWIAIARRKDGSGLVKIGFQKDDLYVKVLCSDDADDETLTAQATAAARLVHGRIR